MAADGGRQLANDSHAPQVCLTCKARKKKCDKALPRCGYCVGKGLRCVYAPWPRESDSAELDLSAEKTSHAAAIQAAAGYAVTSHNACASRLASTAASFSHNAVFGSPILLSAATLLEPMVSASGLTAGAEGSLGLGLALSLQVHRIIRSTGRFVDDVTARYFQGVHRHLPFVSRARFHDSLIRLGGGRAAAGPPDADFSVLLLAICLVTYCPSPDGVPGQTQHERQPQQTANPQTPPPPSRQSLHLAAQSLFSQVRATFPPSVRLVQTGLLLALYEYAHGRPDDALASVACCARMAYAARLHVPWRQPSQTTGDEPGSHLPADALLQAAEAANTWWGVVICERAFLCEAGVPEQPLITTIPSQGSRLPTEPNILDQVDAPDFESIPNLTVCSPISMAMGGFAQAACLSDQVYESMRIPNLTRRLAELERLDAALQEFLAALMLQCQGPFGVVCWAIGSAMRTLFTLHFHILDQLTDTGSIFAAKFSPLEKRFESSRTALDTVTKMVNDIAESHADKLLTLCLVDTMAPSYRYVIRAALRHIHESSKCKDSPWLRSAEGRLSSSLAHVHQRWGTGS